MVMCKDCRDMADILEIVEDLSTQNKTGTATTKDIAVECEMRYPDLHLTSMLTMMRTAKREGLIRYEPSTMLWWLTDDGKKVLKNEKRN